LKIFKAGKEEILIGLGAVVSYIICIINDFHADDWIVLNLLRDGFSHGDFLSMENPGRFRPLTNILLYIRYLLFGDTAFLYYALNIITHATISVMLYRLMVKMELPRKAALLSSIFFAAYFQHYEAVIWLYGVIRELAAIFYIICLWYLYGFVSTGSKRSFWLFAVFSFAGLFVVEDFVIAPAIFMVFSVLFARKEAIVRLSGPVFLTGLLSLIIYFSLRTGLIAHPGIMEDYYYPGFHIIGVLFEYLGWFVIPSPTHPYFSSFALSLDSPLYFIWRGISYIGMFGFIPLSIWLYVKSPKQVRFFILLTYMALIPILPLAYKVGSRNIYLPSIGLAVMAGYFFYSIVWNTKVGLWLKRTGMAVFLIYVVVSVAAIGITSQEYYRTQTLVGGIIDDIKEADVDINDYRYVLLDHIPGRAIIGPAMIYKLNFERAVIASNDPVRGPINIEKVADSLYSEGVPIVVFDYRNGRMVEATEEYIYERKSGPDISE
jgi:hypothetical protein